MPYFEQIDPLNNGFSTKFIQLDHWSKSDTLQYMDKDVLKVYMILAGRTSLERTVRSKKETVNCMEGLDWKQVIFKR